MAKRGSKAGVEGGEKAAEFFARTGRQARDGIEQALVTGALRIERDAKLAAPVDTGRLRASITHRLEDGPKGPVVYVGTNVEYAKFQEFGTSKMAAQPFLFPAFRQNKDQIKQDIIRAIRRELGP